MAKKKKEIAKEVIVISSSSESEDVNVRYIGSEPITEDLLDRLSSGAWLNDEIINAHLHLTCESHADVGYVNTYWMLRKQPVEWQQLRILFIPINLGNSHWALAVMWPRLKKLVYYDSMMNKRRGMKMLQEIWEFLSCESKETSLLEYLLGKLSLSSHFNLECASCQQQSDGSSCGVFVCQWVTRLTTADTSWISPQRFRKVMHQQFTEYPHDE